MVGAWRGDLDAGGLKRQTEDLRIQAAQSLSAESCDPDFWAGGGGRCAGKHWAPPAVLAWGLPQQVSSPPSEAGKVWVAATPAGRAGSSAMTGPFTHSFPGRGK